jgi:RNA polymerase sigma factor (sigma-70 family)
VGQFRRNPRFGGVAGVLLRTQPDARLAAMAGDGGRPAFDEIVRRHGPALAAYATVLAPPSRAEDVVQESLLKAYAALQDGAQPDLLRAWLFRIVRNTAIDEHRGVRHHEQLDENYDGVEQPPQALDRREQLAALVAAIGDLPAAQRQAILKRELEGRGHDEIGSALGLSPGSVRQLIYRARNSLREAAGALVPAGLIRAASMPGADSAIGGVGIASALKLGAAAVVATGTIVAGASIEHQQGSTKAQAQPLMRQNEGGGTGARVVRGSRDSVAGDAHAKDRGDARRPEGAAGGTPARHPEVGRSPSSPGGDVSPPEHGGSDSGPSDNSGPGSGDSGSDDHSGPGSGGGGLEDGGSGGEESSGPGSGGSSGPGGGDSINEGPGGGSGSDDASSLDRDASSDGPH